MEKQNAALALSRDTHALEPQSFTEAFEVARLLHASKMFPESCANPEAAFVILAKGRELGIPMMQACTEISVVKGKVQLSANLMMGLVMRSGLAEFFACVETTAERAVYATKRKGDPTGEKQYEYTLAQAKAAGIYRVGEKGKSVWEAHTADMLRMRAASKLARMVYPDVLTGCYTPDELEDIPETVDARVEPAPGAQATRGPAALGLKPPAAAAPAPVDPKNVGGLSEQAVDALAQAKAEADRIFADRIFALAQAKTREEAEAVKLHKAFSQEQKDEMAAAKKRALDRIAEAAQ